MSRVRVLLSLLGFGNNRFPEPFSYLNAYNRKEIDCMKKLVCLGLVALLAVQTTACGVNAQESDTGNIVVEDIGEAEDKLPERNLKDDRLEQVTESGKLLIGISPDYAPFAFMEDSKDTTKTSAADKETDTTKASVADKESDTTKTSAADNTAQTDDTSTCVGSDVQLGEYIAKQLGVEPLFVEMEFDDCLKAAKEGTVDLVLLGMLPTVLSVRRCHLPDFPHLLPAGSALKAPGILRVRL